MTLEARQLDSLSSMALGMEMEMGVTFVEKVEQKEFGRK